MMISYEGVLQEANLARRLNVEGGGAVEIIDGYLIMNPKSREFYRFFTDTNYSIYTIIEHIHGKKSAFVGFLKDHEHLGVCLTCKKRTPRRIIDTALSFKMMHDLQRIQV